MIVITDKTKCSGCGACFNICPKHCITMKIDPEGFLYPLADPALCIQCGLCDKVCPILNPAPDTAVEDCYAAKHKDLNILKKSSSGGMFSWLAEKTIKAGGVVFGAGYNNDWTVSHLEAAAMEELDNLRRSKYVQSDTTDTFSRAKKYLEAGRKVFFAGTPCQLGGLKKYLGKDYPNLLTADLFCHSVPSPSVWAAFLDQNFKREDIKAIDFRDKLFGWDASVMRIYFKNGKVKPSFPKLLSLLPQRIASRFRPLFILSYSRGCLKGLFSRPSCADCAFKGVKKYTDFTIGDLWGAHITAPDMYDKKGLSVLLVNSDKAKSFLKEYESELYLKVMPFDKMAAYNPYFLVSAKDHPNRPAFYKNFTKEPLNALIPALLNGKRVSNRILTKIRSFIKKR